MEQSDPNQEHADQARTRFLRFCVVGLSGVPVNLLFTWIGHTMLFAATASGVREALASTLGIGVSILTNFLLNDAWTWRDRRATPHGFFGRMGRFTLVSMGAAVVQFGVAMALLTWAGVHYLLAQAAGIAVATAVNFTVNNVWTFAKERE